MQQAFPRLFPSLLAVASLLGCGNDQPEGQAWVGKSFLLDTPAISISRWEKPVALGPLLVNYAPQFLFAVAEGAGDQLSVTIATAQEYVQDPCTSTVQATIRRADYPNSMISVPAFTMHIVSKDPTRPGDSQVTIHDVVFENVLPGRPGAVDGKIHLTIDLPDLCPTMDEAGVPCEVCSWSGERVCQTIEVVEVATQEAAISTVPVGAGEVAAACP